MLIYNKKETEEEKDAEEMEMSLSESIREMEPEEENTAGLSNTAAVDTANSSEVATSDNEVKISQETRQQCRAKFTPSKLKDCHELVKRF